MVASCQSVSWCSAQGDIFLRKIIIHSSLFANFQVIVLFKFLFKITSRLKSQKLLGTLRISPVKAHRLLRFRQFIVLGSFLIWMSRWSRIWWGHLRDDQRGLFKHFREKVTFNDWIHVYLSGEVLLQLKLVADSQQFILLFLQYILHNVQKFPLAEMDKTVEDF